MSKQLTKLKTITLYKVATITTDDGDETETLTNIGTYQVVPQELTDQVSATVYGADINKILRLGSIHQILESLMKSKVNNTSDNISKYRISFDNVDYYKVVDAKTKYIDVERL